MVINVFQKLAAAARVAAPFLASKILLTHRAVIKEQVFVHVIPSVLGHLIGLEDFRINMAACSVIAELLLGNREEDAFLAFHRRGDGDLKRGRLAEIGAENVFLCPNSQAKKKCADDGNCSRIHSRTADSASQRIFASGSSVLMPSSSGILSFSRVRPVSFIRSASRAFNSSMRAACFGSAQRLKRSSGSVLML